MRDQNRREGTSQEENQSNSRFISHSPSGDHREVSFDQEENNLYGEDN